MLPNRIIYCVAVAVVFMVSYAWAEDPYPIDWVRQLGSSGPYQFDTGGHVAVDSAGGAFLLGSTTGSMPGHTNQGDYDVFLARYDADGNRQWTEQFGSTGSVGSISDVGWSVAVDSAGNALLTGFTGG